MFFADRPAVFLLVSTDHGMMIVNRMDYSREENGGVIGVGVEIFNSSHYDDAQLDLLCKLVEMRRESHGDGAVVIDGGANIGAYTLSLAKIMTGWGNVIAIEPQERVYYSLAGALNLNNCFNAKAILGALGQRSGVALIPRIDHTKPHNFGGVSLIRPGIKDCDEVQLLAVDDFNLNRLDLLKLDVEGMELEALLGARKTIERCNPIICAEHIFCGLRALEDHLRPLGYDVRMTGMNVVAIHESDPVRQRVTFYDSREEAA